MPCVGESLTASSRRTLTKFVENSIQIKCGALEAGGRVRRPFQIKSKPNRVQMKAQRVTIIPLIFHHKKRGKGGVMAFCRNSNWRDVGF
jgi:hypothetical protein